MRKSERVKKRKTEEKAIFRWRKEIGMVSVRFECTYFISSSEFSRASQCP